MMRPGGTHQTTTNGLTLLPAVDCYASPRHNAQTPGGGGCAVANHEWNVWQRLAAGYIVDLSGANLNDAKLLRANLSSAILSYADLNGAVLSSAILNHAYLIGAKLKGAN